ncbi:MAG: transposase, partial [Bryobacterales bacterium]|nr:transposase [Bryobacterales bacterium]
MARIRRVVAVGCPHHLTQRGNFRRGLFFDDEDRQTYLALLAGHAADRHLRILGYCLMSNPIHLIAVPTGAGSLSLPMRDAQRDDSRWLHIGLHRPATPGRTKSPRSGCRAVPPYFPAPAFAETVSVRCASPSAFPVRAACEIAITFPRAATGRAASSAPAFAAISRFTPATNTSTSCPFGTAVAYSAPVAVSRSKGSRLVPCGPLTARYRTVARRAPSLLSSVRADCGSSTA